MKVELFDFDLPESSVATHPVCPKDAARLLVVKNGVQPDDVFEDVCVSDLVHNLTSKDVLVFNNTKVIPARLAGTCKEARIEVTLHKRVNQDTWLCFAKPAKRLKLSEKFVIAHDFSAWVEDKLAAGEVRLRFDCEGAALFEKLHRYGSMPIPPYMRRKADASDTQNYQTMFARHEGAVAAPTAGLHFTPKLLAMLDAKGVARVELTLHVGAGTFLPVKVDDTENHVMHEEEIILTQDQADIINATRAKGGRVVAVGTTALRTLESITDTDGKVQAFHGETGIFITPGYHFKVVDLLLTNFHLPRSTLFMLVCAFSGFERMQAAYAHAIANNYRFYSYGDACLLYRNEII